MIGHPDRRSFSIVARGLAVAWVLAAALLAAGPASATVTGASASPAAASLSEIAPTILNVTWRASVNLFDPAGPPVLTSNVVSGSAQIIAGGSVIQTFPQSLSAVATGANGSTVPVTLPETISISPALAVRIARDGGAVLRRTFTDAGGSAQAQVALSVVPTAASPGAGAATGAAPGGTPQSIEIAAVELSFPGGSRYETVNGGATLVAVARISQSGRGILAARWEVADLAATGDEFQPRFRPVGRVQRPVTGSGTVALESPPLPTRRQGIYAVRLVFERPAGLSAPEVRYTVLSATVPERLRLLSPPEGATLTVDTVLTWTPDPGAARQRIEFLDGPAGQASAPEVIAAIEVNGTQSSVTALPFTVDALQGRSGLHWRVVAIDASGLPLAASASQRLGLSGSDGRP